MKKHKYSYSMNKNILHLEDYDIALLWRGDGKQMTGSISHEKIQFLDIMGTKRRLHYLWI